MYVEGDGRMRLCFIVTICLCLMGIIIFLSVVWDDPVFVEEIDDGGDREDHFGKYLKC